jgi:hypothetical protein
MFVRRGSAILRAPEGDPSGGGAGSGGAGGDGDPAKGDTVKTLTEEDIGRIANAAITNQLKRLNLEGKITEAIGGLKIDDKFATLTQQLASFAQPKPDKSDKGDAPGKPDAETQRLLAKLADDLQKEKELRQQALNEAAETKRTHEFATGRQRLYESLKPHASETLHDVWVDHLIHHGRLKVEDGNPLLEVEYAPMKGLPKQKDFLPLNEAIAHLVASEEAKRFQAVPDPADGKGNPGPRGRRANAPTLDSKDPMARVAARLESLGLNFDNEFSS